MPDLYDLRNRRKNNSPQPVVAFQKALCAYELFTLVLSTVTTESCYVLPASCFINNVTIKYHKANDSSRFPLILPVTKKWQKSENCDFLTAVLESLFEILTTKSIVFCDVSTSQAATNLYGFLIDVTYVNNEKGLFHSLKGNSSSVSRTIDDSFNS